MMGSFSFLSIGSFLVTLQVWSVHAFRINTDLLNRHIIEQQEQQRFHHQQHRASTIFPFEAHYARRRGFDHDDICLETDREREEVRQQERSRPLSMSSVSSSSSSSRIPFLRQVPASPSEPRSSKFSLLKSFMSLTSSLSRSSSDKEESTTEEDSQQPESSLLGSDSLLMPELTFRKKQYNLPLNLQLINDADEEIDTSDITSFDDAKLSINNFQAIMEFTTCGIVLQHSDYTVFDNECPKDFEKTVQQSDYTDFDNERPKDLEKIDEVSAEDTLITDVEDFITTPPLLHEADPQVSDSRQEAVERPNLNYDDAVVLPLLSYVKEKEKNLLDDALKDWSSSAEGVDLADIKDKVEEGKVEKALVIIVNDEKENEETFPSQPDVTAITLVVPDVVPRRTPILPPYKKIFLLDDALTDWSSLGALHQHIDSKNKDDRKREEHMTLPLPTSKVVPDRKEQKFPFDIDTEENGITGVEETETMSQEDESTPGSSSPISKLVALPPEEGSNEEVIEPRESEVGSETSRFPLRFNGIFLLDDFLLDSTNARAKKVVSNDAPVTYDEHSTTQDDDILETAELKAEAATAIPSEDENVMFTNWKDCVLFIILCTAIVPTLAKLKKSSKARAELKEVGNKTTSREVNVVVGSIREADIIHADQDAQIIYSKEPDDFSDISSIHELEQFKNSRDLRMKESDRDSTSESVASLVAATVNDSTFDSSNLPMDFSYVDVDQKSRVYVETEIEEVLRAEKEARITTEDEVRRMKEKVDKMKCEEAQSLQKNIASLNEELSSRNGKIEKLRLEAEKLNENVDQIEKSLVKSQGQITPLREAVATRDDELGKLKTKVNSLVHLIEVREEDFLTLNCQIDAHKAVVLSYDEQVEKAKVEATGLKGELLARKVEADDFNIKVASLNDTIETKEHEWNLFNDQILSLQQMLTNRDEETVNLKSQLSYEVIDLKGQLADVEQALSVSAKEAVNLRKEIKSGKKDLSDLQEDTKRLTKTIDESDDQVHALKTKVESQQDMVSSYHQQVDELTGDSLLLKRELDNRDIENEGLKADIMSTNELVKSQEVEAEGLRKQLANLGNEVSTLQTLSSSRETQFVELQNNIKSLNEAANTREEVFVDLHSQIRSHEVTIKSYREEIVELTTSGDKIDEFQNQAETLNRTILSKENEVDKLLSNISSLKQSLLDRDREVGEFRQQVAILGQTVTSNEVQVLSLQGEKSSIEKALAFSQDHVDTLRKSIGSSEKDLNGLRKSNTLLEQTLTQQREETTLVNKECLTKEGNIAAHQMQLEMKELEITSLKQSMKARDAELKASKHEIVSLKESIQSKEADLANLQSSLDKQESNIKELQELKSESESENAKFSADLKAKLKSEEEKHMRTTDEATSLKAEFEAAMLKAEEESRKVAEKEEARANMEFELANLRKEESARIRAEKESYSKLEIELSNRLKVQEEAELKARCEEEARIKSEKSSSSEITSIKRILEVRDTELKASKHKIVSLKESIQSKEADLANLQSSLDKQESNIKELQELKSESESENAKFSADLKAKLKSEEGKHMRATDEATSLKAEFEAAMLKAEEESRKVAEKEEARANMEFELANLRKEESARIRAEKESYSKLEVDLRKAKLKAELKARCGVEATSDAFVVGRRQNVPDAELTQFRSLEEMKGRGEQEKHLIIQQTDQEVAGMRKKEIERIRMEVECAKRRADEVACLKASETERIRAQVEDARHEAEESIRISLPKSKPPLSPKRKSRAASAKNSTDTSSRLPPPPPPKTPPPSSSSKSQVSGKGESDDHLGPLQYPIGSIDENEVTGYEFELEEADTLKAAEFVHMESEEEFARLTSEEDARFEIEEDAAMLDDIDEDITMSREQDLESWIDSKDNIINSRETFMSGSEVHESRLSIAVEVQGNLGEKFLVEAKKERELSKSAEDITAVSSFHDIINSHKGSKVMSKVQKLEAKENDDVIECEDGEEVYRDANINESKPYIDVDKTDNPSILGIDDHLIVEGKLDMNRSKTVTFHELVEETQFYSAEEDSEDEAPSHVQQLRSDFECLCADDTTYFEEGLVKEDSDFDVQNSALLFGSVYDNTDTEEDDDDENSILLTVEPEIQTDRETYNLHSSTISRIERVDSLIPHSLYLEIPNTFNQLGQDLGNPIDEDLSLWSGKILPASCIINDDASSCPSDEDLVLVSASLRPTSHEIGKEAVKERIMSSDEASNPSAGCPENHATVSIPVLERSSERRPGAEKVHEEEESPSVPPIDVTAERTSNDSSNRDISRVEHEQLNSSKEVKSQATGYNADCSSRLLESERQFIPRLNDTATTDFLSDVEELSHSDDDAEGEAEVETVWTGEVFSSVVILYR